jgi:hypothetical protein
MVCDAQFSYRQNWTQDQVVQTVKYEIITAVARGERISGLAMQLLISIS